MGKINSHTQQKLHRGNDDLDMATVVKLQIMKINTILLTEPVFMALIASFIFDHVVLPILAILITPLKFSTSSKHPLLYLTGILCFSRFIRIVGFAIALVGFDMGYNLGLLHSTSDIVRLDF